MREWPRIGANSIGCLAILVVFAPCCGSCQSWTFKESFCNSVPRMHMFSIRAFRQEITTSRTGIASFPCSWGWTVDGRQDQNVADLQGDALFICMDCLQNQKSFIDHNYTLLLGFILSFCEGIDFLKFVFFC